jgi:uncharacterized protein (DUF433 family)
MAQKRRVVHSDPEILAGTPVFIGTRVPLKNLYDYLEAGDSLDEFLDDFPSVTREQAVAALDDVKLCAQNGRIRPGTAGRSTANFLRNPPQTDTTR